MNFLIKTSINVVAFILAFIPTWVYLLVYFFIGPVGFWEKFVLVGLGFWFVGGLQIFLFICWAIFAANVACLE